MITSMLFRCPDEAYSLGLGDLDCVEVPTETDIYNAKLIEYERKMNEIRRYFREKYYPEIGTSEDLPEWVWDRVIHIIFKSN